jgi:hypothetical protein
VTVTVNAVNDAPIALDDIEDAVEDIGPVIINVLANDTDVEGLLDPASVSVSLDPAHGSAVDNPDGTITYTPDPDWAGEDGFVYQVCDSGYPLPPECDTALVTVTTEDRNDPPIADAGDDQLAHLRATVTLDGSGSTDPDQNYPLEYIWQQVREPDDPFISLDLSDPEHPTFEVPFEPGPRLLTFRLKVIDADDEASQWDSVVITVINRPPVADAGADQNVDAGSWVRLNASDSFDPDDPGGEYEMTYLWNQIEGPHVQSSSWRGVQLGFTAPYTPTTLVFELMVWDYHGMAASLFDEVRVTVGNVPPVPVAGEDQVVYRKAPVVLDGSGSYDPDDPEGEHPLTYAWSQVDGPLVQLSDPTLAAPTFTAPGHPCTLTFALSITDYFGLPSEPPTDIVRVTVPPFVHLPLISRYACPEGGPCGPDLVVQAVRFPGDQIEVVIANQGSEPVTDWFYVILYVDPIREPVLHDRWWAPLGERGIIWEVSQGALPLAPGETLTLRDGDDYYLAGEFSDIYPLPLPNNTPVYVQVDAYDRDLGPYGRVLETHEIAGVEYNNVVRVVYRQP